MNTSIPVLTLADAVLMQMREFLDNKTPFSRYDVTTALREKCNNGRLEIPEVEVVGGRVRYFIQKSAVDSIFEQIWRNASANGLPPIKSETDPTGTYRLFSEDAVPSQMGVPPQIGVPSTVLPPISLPPVSALSDAEINRRIDVYMKNCASRGIVPTLKRVQSAIKRKYTTGLSKLELNNILMSLGHKTA